MRERANQSRPDTSEPSEAPERPARQEDPAMSTDREGVTEEVIRLEDLAPEADVRGGSTVFGADVRKPQAN
jgi:hypothetical protein